MGNNTKIEWCDSTWNPVTGCWHGCEYCYAKRIAERFSGADELDELEKRKLIHTLSKPIPKTDKNGATSTAPYPFGFEPTFYEYRLDELKNVTGENVFVCSTADLFGTWAPDEWIEAVFDACLQNRGHRYLFLTKNPKRYMELGRSDRLPTGDEFWYGTTVTDPDTPAFWSRDHHTFVSVEPIMAPFDVECGCNSLLEHEEWFIFGAETGNRRQKVKPEFWWVERAIEQIQARGIPVFMKDSMKGVWGSKLLTEFPW